jgi:hypothetical protein
VCATDRQGNRACSGTVTISSEPDDVQLGGGGCGGTHSALVLPMVAGVWSRRRRFKWWACRQAFECVDEFDRKRSNFSRSPRAEQEHS